MFSGILLDLLVRLVFFTKSKSSYKYIYYFNYRYGKL